MSLKGLLMLLKLGDGASPEVFTTIAGLQDTSYTLNNTPVDTTSKDDAGIRQLLDGKVLQSFSVSGSGVLQDAAIMNTLRDAAIAATNKNFQIVIPGTSLAGGTYEGSFKIATFEENGAHDGAVNFTITLESAGEIAFTDTV